MIRLIGFYDYTVVLTYAGALFGLLGITLANQGSFLAAICCMAGSLVCDTLDGKVARAKKNRTVQQMQYGIQIDSLCDVLSFGVTPAAFFYCLGLDTPGDLILLGCYVLCCVIRLAFFNVLAGEAELGTKGDFRGLPVVCLNIMVPSVYLADLLLPAAFAPWVMRGTITLFGLLYILDFKVRKPVLWKFIAMALVFWVPVFIILAVGA